MSQGHRELTPDVAAATPGLPRWMQVMRNAAQAVITEADVEEIVKNQVARAKQGDKSAIQFVFDQVLGGQQLKGMTLVQNNYAAPEPPPAPKPVPVGDPVARKMITFLEAFGEATRQQIVAGVGTKDIDAVINRLVADRVVIKTGDRYALAK